MNEESNNNEFLLLYGSQTGQAKAIAEEIYSKAVNYGLKANLNCLSLTDKKFNISRENCTVIVVSTTGDGEPPDTALKFWRRIKKRTLPEGYLKHLHYSLLALGDSNYNNFCKCGKSIDKRLQELGAIKFYLTGYGDDAVGLEETVDPWIDGLWLALRNHLRLKSELIPTQIISEDACEHLVGNNSEINSKSNNPDTSLSVESTRVRMSNQVTSSDVASGNKKPLDETNGNSSSSDDKKTNAQAENILTIAKEVTEVQPNSFLYSFPKVNTSLLTLPSVPSSFLTVAYYPEANVKETNYERSQSIVTFPSAATSLKTATVESARWLTLSPDVKKVLELTIDISGSGLTFIPGDSFGFLCLNSEDEVQLLLERLGVLDHADVECKIIVAEHSSKRQVSSVTHLPPCSTLRKLFLTCCDIRAVPKKAFLCKLAEQTSDPVEKMKLLYLSSREGADLYTSCVRRPGITLLDILHSFPTCMTTVETVLENLPRLQPRFYSAISLPGNKNQFKIAFAIVEIEEGQGRFYFRHGVCTGWLYRISRNLCEGDKTFESPVSELTPAIEKLTLNEKPKVVIYKRRNDYFHSPKDLSVPLIMIGPGTGIAPFVGFLLCRDEQIEATSDLNNIGETWLFYGCRYKEKDYLYREELENLHNKKTLTHLIASFSRDPNFQDSAFTPRYVQDNIKHYETELVPLIECRGAKVFVCGDAKNMAKDVYQAFVQSYQKVKGCSEKDAVDFFAKLQEEKHYIQDIWA